MYLLFPALLLTCVSCFAQDTIALRSGQKIIAPIVERGDQYIVYSKSIGNDQVNLKVPVANVSRINYKNGYVEKLNADTGRSTLIAAKIPDVNVAFVDSFRLIGKRTFRYFDLVKSTSPVVAFAEGIYMPNENIWFYKAPDSSRINAFAVSHCDTSDYIFYNYNNAIFLVNYKYIEGQDKGTTSNLLKLPTKYRYTLYPIGRLSYYLLARDTLADLYYYSGTTHKKLLSGKEDLYSILPIDEHTFVACYLNQLVLFSLKDNKQKVLFKSPLPIISAALLPMGAAIISTPRGIYLINKNYTASRLTIPVNDGILKMYNNYLYVLSNAHNMIYKIKI